MRDDTGLDYADQRYFTNTSGRFVTPDPAGDGSNWYAYAGGDPVNSADPSGLGTLCYGPDGGLISCPDVPYQSPDDIYQECFKGRADSAADRYEVDYAIEVLMHEDKLRSIDRVFLAAVAAAALLFPPPGDAAGVALAYSYFKTQQLAENDRHRTQNVAFRYYLELALKGGDQDCRQLVYPHQILKAENNIPAALVSLIS